MPRAKRQTLVPIEEDAPGQGKCGVCGSEDVPVQFYEDVDCGGGRKKDLNICDICPNTILGSVLLSSGYNHMDPTFIKGIIQALHATVKMINARQ